MGGFLGTDKGYLYFLSALGAGNAQGYRLFHYPLGDNCNYRIDVIQTPVKHVQALGNTLYIGGGFIVGSVCFPLLCQIVILGVGIVKLIICVSDSYVKNDIIPSDIG